MRWRGSILAILALAGCGDGGPAAPAVPEAAEPERLSLEVVEGQTVAVPVRYSALRPELWGFRGRIGLEASYGTASAEDIVLMERTEVPLWIDGEGTVEFGLLARLDGAVEGAETLVLRPVELPTPNRLGTDVRVRDAEIEVVITDGPHPCSEVEVRVGESPSVLVDRGFPGSFYTGIYASEIEIVAPASESVIKWIEPADARFDFSPEAPPVYYRTRTLNAWRVESLGDRVRHRMTAQWWNGRSEWGSEPPRFELQVCGGPGYGKFVRCSPTECAVHEEGF